MGRMDNSEYVSRQYRNASNLDARVQLYDYATREGSWMSWLFDQLALRSGEDLLELGCGSGNLWRENAGRIPDDMRILLSDSSEGMLEQARERLRALEARVEFQHIDIAAIPLKDESFDIALANHMLYHVADREQALREVHRILRPGGRFFASTTDWTHLIEIRELLQRFEVDSSFLGVKRDASFFDLENGFAEIGAHFKHVNLRRRRDELQITSVSPLIRYIRSTTSDDPTTEVRLVRLEEHVKHHIERTGAFHVNVCSGVIEAVR
ncbi:MAG: methyltransferase domain-containing protein [bacterium]|nr:methyltransferase domain-containing protein [bacterium]